VTWGLRSSGRIAEFQVPERLHRFNLNDQARATAANRFRLVTLFAAPEMLVNTSLSVPQSTTIGTCSAVPRASCAVMYIPVVFKSFETCQVVRFRSGT
jgi:hypothetical protein